MPVLMVRAGRARTLALTAAYPRNQRHPHGLSRAGRIDLEVQCEPLPKKQDSKQAAALRMIYELRRRGVVDILPFDPDDP